MPPKKKVEATKRTPIGNAEFANAGLTVEQPLIETLETNFMPYAMSVIISRAIPEIDGFKPSHRKLLYTMYKMGLLTGSRTKSANIVGQTMRLNPHGDQAIYETMVRMTRGNEALLHPYVDSKGNFGKAYSRDMAYAASRYTEAKLDAIAAELFRDIDRDTVEMVDNYDGTMKEPSLLPVTFPAILVNSNIGIAVGMASNICPYNLKEVCDGTIALLKNPDADVTKYLRAPDFPGGGLILNDAEAFRQIAETGRGSIQVRSRWRYDKAKNCIEVVEIPPTTTVEAIIDKLVALAKENRLREISDVRDETDLQGLKLTMDLKRGADPEKLMARLFRSTPLQDGFSANFNVLIGSSPRVMGIRELLTEWIAFRTECVRRRVFFEKNQKQEKLHLLEGLQRILLDIDRAIKIIRDTREEAKVVPNLMEGFFIDEVQAEYVAEIKLRHLNREFILKRINEIASLRREIADMELTLSDPGRLRAIIADELREVARKYGKPRRSEIIENDAADETEAGEAVPDYPVHLFVTRAGYFKKITPASWRMSSEHKLKEGDEIVLSAESTNTAELLVFSDRCQLYKTRAADFEETKASAMGDYLPAKLEMDEGEGVAYTAVLREYTGFMLFLFENGKAAKIDAAAYETKTRRRKLLAAYSDKSPLAAALYCPAECAVLFRTANGRATLVQTDRLETKSTKNAQGVQILTLKKNDRAVSMQCVDPQDESWKRCTAKTLPTAGILMKDAPGTQVTF